MNELQLKYGCNPNQKPSRIYMEDGSELPIKVHSGRPGYINFLDAFNFPHTVQVNVFVPFFVQVLAFVIFPSSQVCVCSTSRVFVALQT